jgi:hypothetical protein
VGARVLEVLPVSDLFFMAVLVAFSVLTWGLIVLCDRLMGGNP